MARKAELHVTPRGVAQYPYLFKADTQFNKDGTFRVNLICKDTPELRELLQTIENRIDEKYDEILQQQKEESKKPKAKTAKKKKAGEPKELTKAYPFFELVDAETGEDTGEVQINFKQNKVIKKKDGGQFEVKVNVIDGKKNKVPSSVRIGSGSEGRVIFEIAPYYMAKENQVGVSLRLYTFQLLKLVEFKSNAAGANLLDEDEEGFDASAYETDDDDEYTTAGADTSDDTDVSDEDGDDEPVDHDW